MKIWLKNNYRNRIVKFEEVRLNNMAGLFAIVGYKAGTNEEIMIKTFEDITEAEDMMDILAVSSSVYIVE